MIKLGRHLVKYVSRKLSCNLCPLPNHTRWPRLGFPIDFGDDIIDICLAVKPFTMTSCERILSLCNSVDYVVNHSIPGDIVECGVWRGGSMMAVAHMLLNKRAIRKLYLFDTYEGMTEPTKVDECLRGRSAANYLATEDRHTSWKWAYCPLNEVKKNLLETGFDQEQIMFIKGKVEDTIPEQAPNQISILRLDTDWYESTYHELTHLYPRLSVGGVIIIDDYGHWRGAKAAVDRYIIENNLKLLLNRIDYTGRIGIKLE